MFVWETKNNRVPKGSVELWLDLRGTALAAEAAISRCELGRTRLVDRVFLDPIHMAQDHDERMVFVAPSDRQHLEPFGICWKNTPTTMIDPILAMDTIHQQGQWFFVDTKEDDDDDGDAIQNLLPFLTCRPFLLTNDDDIPTLVGGLAWTCRSKSQVLHAASLCMQEAQRSSPTTESGILLMSANVMEDTRISMALVLPFDEKLWEAAATLLRPDQDVWEDLF